jgi:hypothetical protein
MVFLEVLGSVIALVLFVALLTQVIMPFLFNTPFFPMFRSTTPLLEKVEEAEHNVEEQTELLRLQKRLFDLNQEQAALEKQIADTAVKS